MALTEKYQSLIDMAKSAGVDNLTVQDSGTALNVSGVAPNEQVKQQLWDEYNRLDPDMRSGDLVLNIEVGAGAAAGGGGQTYTVKSGDSLSKIAQNYPGVSWNEIFEANRDQIDDPDMIKPGQVLKIPQG